MICFLELSKWVGTRESTQPTTGSVQVGLRIVYKFQYGLMFDPTHQPANKGSHKYFFVKLDFTVGSC